MSEEFTTITTLEVANVNSAAHSTEMEYLRGNFFGTNDNVAEVQGIMVVKQKDGSVTSTAVDYNASRDIQLRVKTSTITAEEHIEYRNQLLDLFETADQPELKTVN